MHTIKELKAKEKYDNMLKRKNKEIERLNNIITELENKIEYYKTLQYDKYDSDEIIMSFEEILKELKENK